MKHLFLTLLISILHLHSEQISIRAFDLGGGGLKTALLTYDTDSQKMHWEEPQTQLGKCPDEVQVADWIRSRLTELLQKDLDEEVSNGYLFGFSLAGLDKLRGSPLDTFDMARICNLPPDKVACIDDGAAHLVASLNSLPELPKGPVWNFSIGTGVGVAGADANHQVISQLTLYNRFGMEPWRVKDPETGKSIGRLCSAKCFDQIVSDHQGLDEACCLEFAKRWKSILDANFLNQPQNMPAAIVFTGGHIETHGDRLIQALTDLQIGLPIFAGLPRSGLLGAAWNTALLCNPKIPLFQTDINARDALGYTALSLAVLTNDLDLVDFLLQSGAWVDNSDFSNTLNKCFHDRHDRLFAQRKSRDLNDYFAKT